MNACALQLIVVPVSRRFTRHARMFAVTHVSTLETRSRLEQKCVPQIVSWIVTRDAPVSYWPIFFPALETVPEVVAKANSAQSPSFLKRRILYAMKKRPTLWNTAEILLSDRGLTL